MPAIAPTYSVYTDLRNGFTVGIHKIHLLKEQLNTGAETYTWDVPILAPSASEVGEQLGLEGQFPSAVSVTNGGGSARTTVSCAVAGFASTVFPRNPDGSLDLIITTLHSGSANASGRTAFN